MADNVTGIVLDIPQTVLDNIKNADKAIRDLEKTSRTAAANINKDFGTTMVDGVTAFIRKVQEAQEKLGTLKVPTIDASGLSAAVQTLSQAMVAIDKSVNTGAARFGRMAEAIAKLQTANPDPQLFQNIADGITKIGNTSQQTIQNVTQLAQVMAQLAKDIRIVQQAQNAQNANTASAAQYNKLYKEQADLIRQKNELERKSVSITAEEDARLTAIKNRIAEINNKIRELNKKQPTAASYLARVSGEQRVGDVTTRTTIQGAIDYAKQARSLNDLQAAYKNLKAVMATTNPDSKEWRQMNAVLKQTRDRIDEVKKKMGEFHNAAKGAGDIAGQLRRRLAAVFSVAAITGYINKLIEVRAQFELQQTALRAILQDKQKADEVFQQVQQMALQSPFSIMQMTTFTKQLAAYRIEADKLVGTTKMLADVSAGLGVDMQRLILAFGQVKSANYLRATEVRQFTEAGLNIAGELATYFSEIEGRMISVGDVMEMITKRMVRFEDVEEVFKRVTSAGGLFYDMQRKQSETLWGQLQRIKDAISIMFNEIGKDNQGTIAWFLTAIRTLINHWRMLAPIISTVGTAIATVLAVKGIKAFISSLRTMGSAVATLAYKWRGVESAAAAAAVAEKGASTATGIGLVITAVTMLGGAIYGAYQESQKLNEELSRIAGESAKDMWDLVYAFRENASAVRDATKSYDERKKALEELHNTFKDILPDQMLEYENIMNITDGYRAATDAIMTYSAEKARQTAEEAIQTEKEKKYNELIEDAKGRMANNLARAYGLPTDDVSIAGIKGAIGHMMRQIREEVDAEMITTAEEGADRFTEMLQARFGDLSSRPAASQTSIAQGINDIFFGTATIDGFNKYLQYGIAQQAEFAEEYSRYNAQITGSDIELLQRTEETYNRRKRALEQLQTAYLNYYNLRKSGGSETETQDARTNLAEKVNAVNALMTDTDTARVSMDNLVAATTSQTDAMITFDEVQKGVLGSFLNNLIEAEDTAPAILNWAETAKGALDRAGFSQMQLDIIKLAKDWGEAHNIEASAIDRLRISANTTYTSAAQDAKKLSDQADENVLKIEQEKLKLMELGFTAEMAMRQAQDTFGNGKTIDELKKEKQFWADLAKTLGYLESHNDTGGTRDIWTPRLQLIEKVNREYEKLLKYYSKEEAMTRIRQSYGGAVAETFKNTQWADIAQWGDFDDEATIQRMQDVGEASGDAYKRKFLEAAGTIQTEIDIKIEEDNIQTAKDKIQELFDNYELTKTLGGLGLNIDLTYLVGGQPVKLEDVRRKLETELADVRATGGEEELVKTYEEALRKVTDMENKNAVERLKNYNKYLLESMSERVQIELKAQQEISKIRNDETLDEFSKEQAIANRRKQMQEELTKYDFDQFKGSDVYLQTFKDLERASKTQLQYVIDRLKEMQAVNKDLSPLQVKSIAQEIKKAEDALAKQNSLKNLIPNIKTAIEYTKQRNALLSEQVRLQKELTAAQLEQGDAEKLLTELTQNRDAIADKSSQAWIVANAMVEKQQQIVKDIEEKANALGIDLKGITDNISDGEAALNGIEGTWNNIAQTLNAVSSTIGDISEGLDSMGLLTEGLADAFASAQAILGNFVQFGSGVVQAFTDPSPWGKLQGALSAVGGAVKLIGSIFAIGDKKKERQIKRLQEKVENLQKAYEKLHTAIEEAYAFDDYNAGYNQSMRNLQAQRQAIQEQMALEKAKKKTDKDRIKEYENALEELAEREKQLREERYEAMGSLGKSGVMSEAENFVSAWLDAYKETGDGLDALGEHWDEFFENLVLKQASSAVVSKRLGKYIDQINAAIDNGATGLPLSQVFAQIGQNLKNELGIWNEDLKAFFDAVGIKGGQGELLLSDLQKGIQNITEPQAAAIEAYLNSMRFAVFEQNTILTNMLTAIQTQYSTDSNSPMLQEVRAIRALVGSIDDRLSRVILPRNSVGSGYSVKVS